MNDGYSTHAMRMQRSIFYHLPQVSDQNPDIYMDMLLQDVALSVMPIGGRSCRTNFKVTVAPNDKQIEKIIEIGLSGNRSRSSLANSLYNFFRLVAAEVCSADVATYEIVYMEEQASKKLTGFELSFISETQLIEKDGQLYQFVPKEIAQERNVPELIPLPREDLIVFQLPVNFRSAFRNMRRTFSRLSSSQFAMFAFEATKQGIPYDFKMHQRAMKLALVEAIRPIGWNARGMFNDQVLSYYWIRMMLTFHSFIIQLRDAMVMKLNDGIKRIGQRMDFVAEITISGLPSMAEVDDAISKLSSGTMAFTEVMKPFNIHQH